MICEQVCGIEALQAFSHNFLSPYQPSLVRGTTEEVEQRVNILKEKLQEAEDELEKLKKGKQKVDT